MITLRSHLYTRKAYYLLTELFVCHVPKALSELLQKVMTEKLKGVYQHTCGWWKTNKESMTRVSFTTKEKMAFMTKTPAEWGMNLLLKVLKYTNFEPLERYDDIWHALDGLIATRGKVFDKVATKRIPDDKRKELFKCVISDISKLDLETEMELKLSTEIDEALASSTYVYGIIIIYLYYLCYAVMLLSHAELPTKEEGEEFHKALSEQKDVWRDFESKLYERGL